MVTDHSTFLLLNLSFKNTSMIIISLMALWDLINMLMDAESSLISTCYQRLSANNKTTAPASQRFNSSKEHVHRKIWVTGKLCWNETPSSWHISWVLFFYMQPLCRRLWVKMQKNPISEVCTRVETHTRSWKTKKGLRQHFIITI